jgi:hypothetical protein
MSYANWRALSKTRAKKKRKISFLSSNFFEPEFIYREEEIDVSSSKCLDSNKFRKSLHNAGLRQSEP